jgi:hypothetical protein
MTFAHPALAWAALGAVALPIVIHFLFRRRRVPLDWAAMDLLREAVRRTNRRTKFEQWMLLALRTLAVLAVGLAIAVPIADETLGLEGRRTTWMLVIDNGATSNLVPDGASLGASNELDRLLDEARVAISQRGERDRIGVVTAAARPELLLRPTADITEVERVLSRIVPSMTPSDLEGAVRLAQDSMASNSDQTAIEDASFAGDIRKIFIASSFRRGSLREGQVFKSAASSTEKSRTALSTSAAVQAEVPTTQAAVELLATTPASDTPVDVRIRSLEARMLPSGDALAVRVSLSRDGSDLREASSNVRASAKGFSSTAQRSVRWDAGQVEATVEFQLTQDAASAASARPDRRRAVHVELADDRLSPGNEAFAIIDVRPEIEVGIIGRRGSLDTGDLEQIPSSLWIARALAPVVGSGIRVREIDPSVLDDRALLGLDAVVVARPDLLATASMEALGTFVRAGGVVVVMPFGDSLTQTWSTELFSRLGVPVRLTDDVKVLETALRLADEQPRTPLLSTVRPELDAMSSPIEATRLVELSGFAAGEVVLSFANGAPLLVAQRPSERGPSESRPTERDPTDGVLENRARDVDVAAQPSSSVSVASEMKASAERDVPTNATAGLVVVFASAPELKWTNLPVKPLMVPLMQEIVRAGLQIAASRDEVAVGSFIEAAPSSTLRTEVAQGSNDATISTGPDGVAFDVVRVAGVWRSDTQLLLASNVREDSIALAPVQSEDVRAAFTRLGDITFTQSRDQSSQDETARLASNTWSAWSFPLFVIALALLVAEAILAKVFSHLSVSRASDSALSASTLHRIRATRGGGS